MLGLIIGMVFLIVGAEMAGKGAKKTALAMGISPLFISLTLTAVLTSLPELAIAVTSAFKSLWNGVLPGLVFANSTGSMIFQGTLSLAIIGLIRSFSFSRRINTDLKVAMFAAVLLTLFSIDGSIGRFDGAFLILFEVVYLRNIIGAVRKKNFKRPEVAFLVNAIKGILILSAGIILMIYSSSFVVDGARDLSLKFGWGDEIVGTITGYGTSFPELFFSVTVLVFLGMQSAAIGNLVGSNSFILTVPIGLAALIAPQNANLMLAAYTCVVTALNYVLLRDSRITRIRALILGLAIIPYLYLVFTF